MASQLFVKLTYLSTHQDFWVDVTQVQAVLPHMNYTASCVKMRNGVTIMAKESVDKVMDVITERLRQ